MKKRINISLDEETVERLKELAEASHKNVSQWITDAVWNEEKVQSQSIEEKKYDKADN